MGLRAYRTSHAKNIFTLSRIEPREMWEEGMFEFYVKAMKPTERKKRFKEKIKMSILTEQIPPSKNPWTRWVPRTLQIKKAYHKSLRIGHRFSLPYYNVILKYMLILSDLK